MIHIYGDSHAMMSFYNLNLPNKNNWHTGVTMFRIGRDNMVL